MEKEFIIEKMDETYEGKKTGKVVYHAHKRGSVLGRGYSEQAAIADYERRLSYDRASGCYYSY